MILLLTACKSGPSDVAAPDLAPPCQGPTRFTATGFFHVEQSCGRSWLVDPKGQRFFSTGVNHLQFEGDYSPSTKSNPYAEAVKARYGTQDRWAAATAA